MHYLCLLQECMLTCGGGCQVRLLRGVPLLLPLLPVQLLLLLLMVVGLLLGRVAPRSVRRGVARQDRYGLRGALPDAPVPHGPPALVRPLLRRRLLPRRIIRPLVALRSDSRRRLRPRRKHRGAADGAVLLPLQP